MIQELAGNGRQAEYLETTLQKMFSHSSEEEEEELKSLKEKTKISQHDWIIDLSQQLKSHLNPILNGGDARISCSTLVVLPRFHAHNAEKFKAFGATINTALQKLTDGRIEAQVFHSEYVCERTTLEPANNDAKRSPYPALLINLREH